MSRRDEPSSSKHDRRGRDECEGCFLPYRKQLGMLFEKYPHIVEDENDFWLFLTKYQDMEKKRKNKVEATLSGENKFDLPVKYDPMHLVNVRLNISEKDLRASIPLDRRNPAVKNLAKFVDLILLYGNFKQKEKFSKLTKLRATQKELPVASYKSEILEAICSKRVVIIAGDTGCGKSTQIPQFLLEFGYNRIACTQPRRIACISLSKRVARETLSEYDTKVGYQIRFEKRKRADTKILFLTEGLLLRQASGEDMLSDYDVVVLDEVHERHLQGDFLLGIAKCLLHQRSDLKLALMSATINIELFANYFGDLARVVQVPGRLFPIKLQYMPVVDVDDKKDFDPAPYVRILQLIDGKYPVDERGDVLMFLSGTKKITAVVEAAKLYAEKKQNWFILPLHSSLSLSEQDKVFDYPPEGCRKCVVSTNIAETSVTIDGIRFVVDSGKVNEVSFDPVCKMTRLKEFWISRASAEQRKGRAGRTGPGVCFRLYSEAEYAEMSEYTVPEIQRVPLDSVLLQMIAMGLPDVRKFPFIEPPALSAINNAVLNLRQHSAVDADEKLTEMGKMLAKLPMDIPFGKMLITGSVFYQLEPVLSLAAVLSVQSPYTHNAFRNFDAQEARKDLDSDHGDPITLLNTFREWLRLKGEGNGRNSRGSYETRKWCRKRGLEEQRFYEMIKLRSQFKDFLVDCGLISEDLKPVKCAEEMTKAERISRHGELKQLRQMKRKLEVDAPRKPKYLKPEGIFHEEEEERSVEEGGGPADIHDIEFRLRNNVSQVEDLLKGTTATSYSDLTMLKIIFCGAVYPQIAIPDEYNALKNVKDQLYHTVEKSHVSLHPNCVFTFNPEILRLEGSNVATKPPHFKGKGELSCKHQVLFYTSLFETTKVYLVNPLRMPAAQAILLFSQRVETNADFSRIICDRWIELKFLLPSAAEKLTLKICKIRALLEDIVTEHLKGSRGGKSVRDVTIMLLELLNTQVFYTVRRLLPADLKSAYVGPFSTLSEQPSDLKCNPFGKGDLKPNVRTGGLDATPFLTYNCLEDEIVSTYDTWSCEWCEMVAAVSTIERLQHIQSHAKDDVGKESSQDCSKPKKANSREYSCGICDKTFHLTPTEILKHKKEHAKEEGKKD